jgi:ABC-2 type transport system permease protein
MFNSAIFWKTARDSAMTVVAAGVGITAFLVLFVWSMLDMGAELMKFVSNFPFLKKLFEAALGIDVTGDLSINILFATGFTHAMVLMLSLSVIIATTSRVIAGEIERGTADLLLTLPMNRSEVYFSTALVWIVAATILAACPVFGVFIGTNIFETAEPVFISDFIKPAINFFFLLLAVGGISSLFSSLINRRGLAVATVVGIILFSIVLNFVEPFIEAIRPLRFIGLLNYFRPVDIVRSGEWPIGSMLALFTVGATCWGIGLIVFCRKDIPTA